jgi:hypothetical protein
MAIGELAKTEHLHLIPLDLANSALRRTRGDGGDHRKRGGCWAAMQKRQLRLVVSQIGQQLALSQINDDRSGNWNASSGKSTNGGFWGTSRTSACAS